MIYSLTFIVPLIFFVMAERPFKVIDTLRRQVESEKNRVWLLQSQVNEYKNKCAALNEVVNELKREKKVLDGGNQKKRKTVVKCSGNCVNLRPVLVKKPWHLMSNARSKLNRKRLYRGILNNSIQCLTECKRAKVTLGFEKHHVDLVWTESEMQENRSTLGISENRYHLSNVANEHMSRRDIRCARPKSKISDFKTSNGLFGNQCKYSASHIRSIVSVLDEHRISHKAYQHLKNACQGHMPSLNEIKDQKHLMSIQLPLTTHGQGIY